MYQPHLPIHAARSQLTFPKDITKKVNDKKSQTISINSTKINARIKIIITLFAL